VTDARLRTNTKPFTEDWIHYRESIISLSVPQMAPPQLALILGTLGVFVVYWRSGQRQRRLLPPGHRKLPLIGSLLSMPSSVEWETFTKWGKEYSLCFDTPHNIHLEPCTDSDIIHVNALGTSIVILNSYEVAVNLLDKRSGIYSSR